MPLLSVVVPHWPIDEEVDAALADCLASLPHDCEKLVIVNEGTGYARNVNRGLRLAQGEYVAVVGNDTRVVDGNVYDLCVPNVATSPEGLGRPGVQTRGLHGTFWCAHHPGLDRLGVL